LNLPPEIRYFPENLFIVGLTPSPSKPDAVRLIHLLDPVIETILQYQPPGKHIVTHRHPEGVAIQTKIIPLIADLPAARETGGFLSHKANCFCWFCNCKAANVESLTFDSWENRSGTVVKEQAQTWLSLTTISARKNQAKETGVRWSSLHRLPYWDPVRHTILGFMHNWLEGVLQHQLRKLWGIGRDDEAEKMVVADIDAEKYSESDISESADELQQLHQEALEAQSAQPGPPPASPPSHGSSTPRATPAASLDFSMDDESDLEDPDYGHTDTQTSFNFTDTELQAIRHCIQTITIPTWVGRPPTNLGEKGHGKLKADQYLILFTAIFPLILPEIWTRVSPNSNGLGSNMLQSFYYLVAATNIIVSFSTSNAEAESFTAHYVPYRASIQQLYTNFHSLPNHHYAMHNELLLKYWGPLAGLSEFPGERINGMLQKIKTNKHLCI
jgi:hypothetical protein